MLIRPFDVDRLRSEFHSARPFPFICIDNFLVEEEAQRIAAAYPSFDDASGMGREFANMHERVKVQVTDSDRFPAPVAELSQAISSPEFLAQVSHITGIPDLLADPTYCGGGMHIHGPGGALDVHVDFNVLIPGDLHRRLNIITYLNPDWDPAWGGAFEAWDEDVKTCHHRVLPLFNRCVMFRTSESSFHGVDEVRCPPALARRSFSAFYYTAAPPEWWGGIAHDTIYKARPNEHWKRHVSMPIREARIAFKRRKEQTKSHVKRWLGRS